MLSISVVRGLRLLARERKLEIVIEGPRSARRVHNVRELRAAMLQRTPLILLSPLYPTISHPDWQPLPRMRAAALARLGGRTLLALGGMDARRFARIRKLGFRGWAGITAFRT
jgi:thiamine-phosphate pyrophosphorylase